MSPPRSAAVVSILSVILMAAGAVTILSAADPFLAFQAEGEDIRTQLAELAGHESQIVTGLWIWILGIVTMAIGISLLARQGSNDCWRTTATTAATASGGAALVFYSAMIGYVTAFPEQAATVDLATVRAIGVTVDMADWFATAFMLGLAGSAAVWAGEWAPKWLRGAAVVNLGVAVLSLVLVALGHFGPALVVVPVGMLHLAMASVVLLRTG